MKPAESAVTRKLGAVMGGVQRPSNHIAAQKADIPAASSPLGTTVTARRRKVRQSAKHIPGRRYQADHSSHIDPEWRRRLMGRAQEERNQPDERRRGCFPLTSASLYHWPRQLCNGSSVCPPVTPPAGPRVRKPHRAAKVAHRHVDLGAQANARSADGLILGLTFRPPSLRRPRAGERGQWWRLRSGSRNPGHPARPQRCDATRLCRSTG